MKSLLKLSLALAGGAIIWGGTSAWAQRVRIPTTVDKIPTSPTLKDGVTLDVATQLSILTQDIKELKKENADLKKQLADVEKQSAQSAKDMVAVRLLLPAMDKAVGALGTKFQAHQHPTPFSYRSFRWLNEAHKDLQGDFYVPYIWLGTNPNLNQLQKEQAAEKWPGFNKTGKPVP